MSKSKDWLARLRTLATTVIAVMLTVIVGTFVLTDLPVRLGYLEAPVLGATTHDDNGQGGHEDHGAHDDHSGHGHAGHSETDSIEISGQARANMRLRTAPLTTGEYTEYTEIPGRITNWPGRTHLAITSPLTGVLNSILVTRGELVSSGTPLFTLRLTHQDLVNTQQTFLTKLGEMDVEQREIKRLSQIATSGAIARNKLIAREYERDKLMAGVRASRQAMLLHGLTEAQITRIERTRELVREITVYAPILHEDHSLHHESLGHANSRMAGAVDRYAATMQPSPSHPRHIDAEFLITKLDVRRGQAVEAGEELAQLSDFSQILIEGQAYQHDSETLRQATQSGAQIQAALESSGAGRELIDGLKIVSIGSEIGLRSRSLPFYVSLENEIERSEKRGDKRYVSWRYKPGQRLTLRLPISRIENAIVVPKDAVAEEGTERYLFVENGDHFDRIPVVVLARDSISVAIANDGQVWPGQSIAISGAHQLQMALKNKSGGAIDPHAGHNH